MLKNKKGISMVILVISIIVILIIGGIGVTIGSQTINDAHKQTIKTNMLLIEAKAKLSEESVAFKTSNKNNTTEIEQIKTQEYIGTKLSAVTEQKVTEQINLLVNNNILPSPEGDSQEFAKYYYLNQDNLNSFGLNEVKESEGAYYFVKYDEEKTEVVFTQGYKDLNGNVYYTLSQLK